MQQATRFQQQSSLYKHTMYTVVPVAHRLQGGVLPEDQGFHDSKVFLWDTWQDLMNFSEQDWKKVLVKLPPKVRFGALTRFGAVYGIPYVAAAWILEEANGPPAYID